MRVSFFAAIFSVFFLGAGDSRAQAPGNLRDLARLDADQLAALFEAAPRPEALPHANTRGLVFFQPGKWSSRFQGRVFQCLWHGKALNAHNGVMTNRVAGAKFIHASMRLDESFTDGDTAVILDYSGMQKGVTQFADGVRDEIREVSPGLWLGRMWLRGDDGLYQPSYWFALQEID